MASFPCSCCRKECLSEFLGTYLLVVIGPASIIVASLVPSLSSLEALVLVASSFGSAVGLVILLLGRYSGAVINPAITLGSTLARILHSKYFVPYLFFQVAGSLLAGLTLRVVFLSVDVHTQLGSTRLAAGVDPAEGLFLEATGTFILTISALVASVYVKGLKWQALLVGSTLFVLILFIGPITGAGFNPSRSLGPSLASGHLENLYVYFVGPIVGASLAGLVFKEFRNVRQNGTKLNIVCLC